MCIGKMHRNGQIIYYKPIGDKLLHTKISIVVAETKCSHQHVHKRLSKKVHRSKKYNYILHCIRKFFLWKAINSNSIAHKMQQVVRVKEKTKWHSLDWFLKYGNVDNKYQYCSSINDSTPVTFTSMNQNERFCVQSSNH